MRLSSKRVNMLVLSSSWTSGNEAGMISCGGVIRFWGDDPRDPEGLAESAEPPMAKVLLKSSVSKMSVSSVGYSGYVDDDGPAVKNDGW